MQSVTFWRPIGERVDSLTVSSFSDAGSIVLSGPMIMESLPSPVIAVSSAVGPSVTDSGPSGGRVGSKIAACLYSASLLLLVVTIAYVVQVNVVESTNYMFTHSSSRFPSASPSRKNLQPVYLESLCEGKFVPVTVTVCPPALFSTVGLYDVNVATILVSPAPESTFTRPYWSTTLGFHLPAGTVLGRVQTIDESVLVSGVPQVTWPISTVKPVVGKLEPVMDRDVPDRV
jgi:hypothetical protein